MRSRGSGGSLGPAGVPLKIFAVCSAGVGAPWRFLNCRPFDLTWVIRVCPDYCVENGWEGQRRSRGWSLFPLLKQLPVVWICYHLFNQHPDGHVGCSQSFAIPDRAAMNTLTHVSWKNS